MKLTSKILVQILLACGYSQVVALQVAGKADDMEVTSSIIPLDAAPLVMTRQQALEKANTTVRFSFDYY